MTQQLYFFHINDAYINQLKAIDSLIQSNASGIGSEKRPYIGVLLVINGLKYIAPLSSYKPAKHDHIRNISLFKVHELQNPTNMLCVVQLNNMFPVTDDQLIPVVIDVNDLYGRLLFNEYEFIKANQDKLIRHAQQLYSVVNASREKGETTTFTKICCNFKNLEAHLHSQANAAVQPQTNTTP